jgi:hypothetical protein
MKKQKQIDLFRDRIDAATRQFDHDYTFKSTVPSIRGFQGEYRFLSNFWPSSIMMDGDRYDTVEAAYQAARTLSRDDRRTIRRMPTPGRAKRAGKLVTVRHDWDGINIRIMTSLVRSKFSAPAMAAKLAATYPAELVEDNAWGDVFWGTSGGKGENHLGRILMAVRFDILKWLASVRAASVGPDADGPGSEATGAKGNPKETTSEVNLSSSGCS